LTRFISRRISASEIGLPRKMRSSRAAQIHPLDVGLINRRFVHVNHLLDLGHPCRLGQSWLVQDHRGRMTGEAVVVDGIGRRAAAMSRVRRLGAYPLPAAVETRLSA
jgi:hypothetical protein